MHSVTADRTHSQDATASAHRRTLDQTPGTYQQAAFMAQLAYRSFWMHDVRMLSIIGPFLRQYTQPSFISNFVSLGIVAVCGVLLHVVIGAAWGSSALGAFNQVLGAYLLAGQFACAGQQNAALRFTAADPQSIQAIARGSLILCSLTAVLIATVFWSSRGFVGRMFDSDATARGMAVAAPGVFLFAMNKTILALLNGLNWMIWFSVIQALRFIVLIALVAAAAWLNLDSDLLPFALTGSELAIFAVFIVAFAHSSMWRSPTKIPFRELWEFGMKSLPASSLSEINQRADVLVLALFVSDSEVGVYSLASTVVEGFGQALLVLRSLFAPTLVTALQLVSVSARVRVAVRVRNFSYGFAVVATLFALLAFPLLLSLSGLDRNFSGSFGIFAILQIGTTLAAGYIVLGTILMLGGRPADQSIYVLIVVSVNICANLLLASLFGATGAAFAAAGSNVLAALLLRWMMRQRLGLPI